MKYFSITAILFFFISSGVEAQNPAPAREQSKRILLLNGRAHIGNGSVIENSAIGFEKGKIILIGDAITIRIDRSAYDTIINIPGKEVYPGLIAMNTTLGINEIELVRATNDYNEAGPLNPSSRTIVAYNTDSKVTPTVRSNGVLLAQITSQGGLVSGSSSVVELDAWNWEDASYKADEGIHLNWPSMRIFKAWWAKPAEEQQKNQEKALLDLHLLFDDAKAYAQEKDPAEANQHLEAMRGLFDHRKKLYVHCNYVKEIVAAVNFAAGYNLQMVLVGGADAWQVAALLKEKNIPVVLGRTHSLPSREDEAVDLPYKLPFLLQQAGVAYCNSVDGFWQVRNLPFVAGTPVAYGLNKEQALESITLAPAKIMGIDKTVGSLETGKDATLVVSTGDVLDMRTNNIEMAFIRGRQINLDNIQKQLYNKYMNKYGLK
jgi:imidazolonepropionase-like amidohydrolase